jgi:hypothetical protein
MGAAAKQSHGQQAWVAAQATLSGRQDARASRARSDLISSAYKGARNIMTLGWHMMLEYDVVACYV